MGMRTRLVAILTAAFMLAGCSQPTEISPTELAPVVARDGMPVAVPSIPDGLLDRLSAHRVVIVGETHFLREQGELLAELVRTLHARGTRQLLLEWPQMADWLLADFVGDGGLEPGWQPPISLGGQMITTIRDFNRTLPQGERVQVRAIDVNLGDYGGSDSFVSLLESLSLHLADAGPLAVFLQGDYSTPKRQSERLETLRSELRRDREALAASWGASWYDTVVEMAEVEAASIPIRAMREDRYDLTARLREDVMKRLADLRLAGYPHKTLINVGGNHAQKQHLKGTEQEWLGDYLVHRSPAVGGSAIVLVVTAARIVAAGGTGPDDQLTASPENEIFRTMNAVWSDQTVFLPVDDAIFLSDGVPMNFEGTIYVGSPKRHYDWFVLFPLAHRLPVSGAPGGVDDLPSKR